MITTKNKLRFSISNAPGTSGDLVQSTTFTGYVGLVPADDTKQFSIHIEEGDNWEVRTGCVYTSSSTTLSRGTLDSSSTGSAINFTSNAIVSGVVSAKEFNLDFLRRATEGDITITQTPIGAGTISNFNVESLFRIVTSFLGGIGYGAVLNNIGDTTSYILNKATAGLSLFISQSDSGNNNSGLVARSNWTSAGSGISYCDLLVDANNTGVRVVSSDLGGFILQSVVAGVYTDVIKYDITANKVLVFGDLLQPTKFASATNTSGSTVVVPVDCTAYVNLGASTLAALTFTLPSTNLYNGQTIRISTIGAITALTVNGGTIIGAPGGLAANSSCQFIFRTGNLTWYRVS
jgi:hypothetical protein